jgi:hypothetical protein
MYFLVQERIAPFTYAAKPSREKEEQYMAH